MIKYSIGDMAKVSKTISESDIYSFAGISGDFNPVHVNSVEASKSVFGRQIAHGFLVGSLISNCIGMKLPGDGTIYMEQDMKFLKPVYIGDTVTACVKVSEIINEKKNVLKLATTVLNQNNDIVIDGYAVVKAPKGEEQ
ncbi:MaoC family dehydratase [Butyrivibrio sp. M55]|uniref:MaoC family dehydratase n=1 Tax=Butyrivibrio sp. M55 TaxID=1855323 RepID=UPI0008E4BB27|nr:MaoC family dehydratase [Butyrivibrio sp. M55]SFU85125.1 3-hydroxybutyryl-CoA dehydratase [Butyrivibrio sp. M55]